MGKASVKKRIIAAAMIALMAVSMCAMVYADIDIGYTGVIDSFTGEPEGSRLYAASGRMQLAGSMFYDSSILRYVYVMTSGSEILSTVADGMVICGEASISVPEGVNSTLYLDGEPLSMTDYSVIVAPGHYVLSVTENSGVTVQPISFTIVNDVTGELYEYRMPTGFAVTEVCLDGVLQNFESGKADLSREGQYEITYCLVNTERKYNLNITVDHTPPTLALSEVEDGLAKGPVDISDLEEGASVLVLLDGDKIGYTPQLTQSGNYTLRVEDAAGNVTVYTFTIGVYLNVSSWVFIALLAVILAGTILYLVFSRKKLRIR